MITDAFNTFASQFDDVFTVIGLAILGIEILKGLFERSLSWRGVADMVANVSTQIPFLLVEVFLMSVAYIGMVAFSEAFISWTLPTSWPVVILALIAADLAYYWEHRMAHRIRLFWTQHAVHHSSRFMNITVSVRFGAFEGAVSVLALFPFVLMGIPPALLLTGTIIVLGYQTWIHTELIGKLGPLEGLLNTPSNHRVHHGCDEKYIDKNYGGILIIWDRLFGTYQAEEETPRYGLKRDYSSVNPISVWFSELPGLFSDLKRARNFKEVWMYLFAPPGWQPRQAPDAQNTPQTSSGPIA